MSVRSGLAICVVAVITLVPRIVPAADPADYKQMYEEQKKRNDELERRIQLLEEKDAAAPYVAKEDIPESTLGFLNQTELSGFVSASYLYNFNSPENRRNTGRGFDTLDSQFMFNKAVVVLEKPVEANAFDIEAGFAVKVLFGRDARFTQTDLTLGSDGDLFAANFVMSLPIGNGIKITAGKYETPMGYEASFTEENQNWSGGNQWALIEPFTHTGLKVEYAFDEQWEVAFLVNNGWDRVRDNNNALSYMGQVSFYPRETTTFSVIGFGGPEQAKSSANWRRGVSAYAEHKLAQKVTGAAQLDYGIEDGADASGGAAEWFAAGAWLVYQWTEKVNFAFRGDYLKDGDGSRTSGSLGLPVNNGMELYSATLTINVFPIESLRLAPEIRWDHSSVKNAFDGGDDQITIGVGGAFFF